MTQTFSDGAGSVYQRELPGGEQSVDIGSHGWLEIAGLSFAAGAEDLSRFALEQSRARLGRLEKKPADQVRAAGSWLAQWYGRAQAAAEPVAVPAGEVPVAVLGYRQPDRDRTSRDLGDYLSTLAVLGVLARSTHPRFAGEPKLVVVADRLRGAVVDTL